MNKTTRPIPATPALCRHRPSMLLLTLSTVVSMALVAGMAGAAEADWPQFRGPDRNGIGTDTDLAASWPEGGPQVVWRSKNLGEGYGSVAVVGPRIFVQGTRDERSLVFALDATTGKEVWATDLSKRRKDGKGGGPRSTPTVSGNTVFVVNEMGEVASLDKATGKPNWQFNMLERFDGSNIGWGISESPLLDNGRLYVMPGGKKATVAALDPKTGETLWTSSGLDDKASYSSLIAVDVGGRRALVGFTQEAGVGLDAETGELLWRFEEPANRTANAATPIFDSNLAFYTSSYGVGGGAVKLTPTASGIESEKAYFDGRLQNHHGGVVLYDGYLYGFFGPSLGCVDFKTGEVQWRNRSVGKGSLAIADGKLFLLGENRQVGLAVASPEGYKELGRFEIEDHDWPSWANPVVAGGRLYIRNWNELVAYDVSK